MNNRIKSTADRFHGHLDGELAFKPGRVVETRETKYVILQERDVSYRFHLHQHPYVQQLMQRLLRQGNSGLQAADTEYHTRAKLSVTTSAQDLRGRPVQLLAGDTLYLASGATVTLNGTTIQFVGRNVLSLLDGSPVAPGINAEVILPGQAVVRRSNGDSIKLDADAGATLVDGTPLAVMYSEVFTPTRYNPSAMVQQPYPVKDLDFTSGGAYSAYNWELFFHIPITIALHLSKNQRFSEAQRWFHYLFDPTDDSDGPTPERFWKVRPFQTTDVKKIEEILVNLATGADEALRAETIRNIKAWEDAPFRPHVIARYRQQAYMYKTVMAYLDNLFAWGDSLFRQDTGEAIDEAMMLYVLAANILGPRPQPVPKKGMVRPQTYANLRQDIRQFGVVFREIEADLPFDRMPFPREGSEDEASLVTLRGLGKALYFCVPRNDKLLGYWDTVADRLFKIRNSLNFQGIFRQLALFEPPIDPALLARATAAGLDAGAIVNGLNQPLPLVRFQLLVQRAAEICQEVKSLGNYLLSAMEKEDGEAMAILRAKHERTVMDMVEHVRYAQVQEAIKSKEGLLQTLALAVQRYTYYERQLGKKTDEIEQSIPEFSELDKDSLEKMRFAMEEGELDQREIVYSIARDLGAESGGRKLNIQEAEELRKLKQSHDDNDTAADIDRAGSILAVVPDFTFNVQPFGTGSSLGALGGGKLAAASSAVSSFWRSNANSRAYEAGNSAKIGSYTRREQDWSFQSNLSSGEITQVFKQLRAAEIREAIADRELKNHRQQMKHAEEIERFLNEEGAERKGKKTNKALYAWMKREVKGLYGQCFQFAFDIAKKAERALQHELGSTELSYLQFGYLAGNEGLLAGEKLYFDIKRMEMAYHDLNQREYELTKHVSLLQVNPMALLQLRAAGRCTVALPETLFDMDGPGHYFRRIKTLAVSIPCVTGPFVSVNCTLTLIKSSIRKSPILKDAYKRENAEDDRFNDYYGSLQSIVTSSAQNDTGLFETNLRDERYLPFENSGVISEWQLELPANPSKEEPAQFDYSTISDVILHVRYTAREGGTLLRNEAMKNVTIAIQEAEAAGSTQLFSARYDFPTEWAKFQGQPNPRYELAIALRAEHYPFWSQTRAKRVQRIDIVVRRAKDSGAAIVNVYYQFNNQPDPAGEASLAAKGQALGNLLVGQLTNIAVPTNPLGALKLLFDDKALEDMWIMVTWNTE